MSVLETQRGMQAQQHQHQQPLLHHFKWPPAAVKMDPSFQLYHSPPLPSSLTNNSYPSLSQTKHSLSIPSTTKKRKPQEEFDHHHHEAEEEYCVDKGMEGEEQSEITVKSSDQTETTTTTMAGTNNDSKDQKSSSRSSSKPDYIHVRARRGQATDRHSLAERARREKISKKMRCLQDLVPGCNKVTGKAGMLDEIINYVQSLQKQVEFLSMKLAASNPKLDFNVDNLIPKEQFPAYMANFPAVSATLEMGNSSYFQLLNPIMIQGGGSSCSVDTMPNSGMPQRSRKASSSVTILPEGFLDSSSCDPPPLDNSILALERPPSWDTDWQNLYNNLNFQRGVADFYLEDTSEFF